MDKLTNKDLAYFKEHFTTERAKLQAALSEPTPDKVDHADLIDSANAITQQAMDNRLKSRDLVYLQKIDAALARIERGEFGLCESCDEPIEKGRLKARPTATLCVTCKEEEEKFENSRVKSHTGWE